MENPTPEPETLDQVLSVIQQVKVEFHTPLTDLEDISMPCGDWADITEAEELKLKESVKKAAFERTRKLFVGNVSFIIDSTNSESDSLRIAALLYIFSQFGPIETIRIRADKRYCFIIYQNSNHAQVAIKHMSIYENRVKSVEQTRITLGTHPLSEALPKPNFYCRWPKDSRCPKNPRVQKRKNKSRFSQRKPKVVV
jgi:hypothetical protein